TFALGKWDHTPVPEASQSGPFQHWASGEGFDHYYGFMAADADDYRTLLFNAHNPSETWMDSKNYHLTTDLADRAILNFTSRTSIYPDRPFFLFWAPSAMHSPHQVEKKYIDMYKGKFDMGWDKAREMIFAKQMEMKLLPAGTKLSNGIPEIPRWDSLSAEQKKLYARQMEVFAAMMTQTDEQIGRMIATLKRIGQYDNTLIMLNRPKGIQGKSEIRNQYSYVIDLMPTALEVTGTKFMEEVDGVKQMPLDGISLAYSFNKADAPSARTEQYYEQFGNRAMYKDGWKAVTIHGNRMPWVTAGTFPFEKDVWELYNLN